MGKVGSILLGILTLFLLLGAFRQPIIDGIKGWRTQDVTEDFVVTTGAVTTANVTLSYDLYQAATAEIIDITSSNATETTVAASSYTEATLMLFLSGLDESNTRTLTIEYYGETDDTVMQVLGPFLGILIFGGSAFGILWAMYQGKH